MPRPRNPKRDEAFRIWKENNGKKRLKDIATELDLSDSQIRKWKNQDKWGHQLKGNVTNKTNSNVTKQGAPFNNKNAKGNRGGKAPAGNENAKGNSGGAAPKRNKNAVVTGEYETIFESVLNDSERELYSFIDTSPLVQLEENIRILSIRELRMMKRINDVTNGLSDKERRVLQELQTVKKPMEVYDDEKGGMKIVMTKKDELVITEIEETQYRKIDDILKIEEALTRIQDKKQKAIKMKHEIDTQFKHKQSMDKNKVDLERAKANIDDGKYEDDGFIEALGEAVEVWNDDSDNGSTEA